MRVRQAQTTYARRAQKGLVGSILSDEGAWYIVGNGEKQIRIVVSGHLGHLTVPPFDRFIVPLHKPLVLY
jgi:hypothetical protein